MKRDVSGSDVYRTHRFDSRSWNPNSLGRNARVGRIMFNNIYICQQ